MKTKILLSCFVMLTWLSQGQNRLSYHFQNTLAEATRSGAALSILGDTGTFVLDTLNEISGRTATVYRFARNNGVQLIIHLILLKTPIRSRSISFLTNSAAGKESSTGRTENQIMVHIYTMVL